MLGKGEQNGKERKEKHSLTSCSALVSSFSLAVRYLFETSPSKAAPRTLEVEEFLATEAKNSYEIPWILVSRFPNQLSPSSR